jgi:hypothetical protein
MKEYLDYRQLKHIRWSAIERLQNKRFQVIAQHMLPHVKVYRELFKQYRIDVHNIKSIDDWKRLGLPLLKKSFYQQHPEDFVVKIHPSQAFERYKAFLHAQESAAGVALFLKALTHRKMLEKEIKRYYYPKMPAFSGGTESGHPVPVFITGKQKENLQGILDIAAELIFSQFRPANNMTGMNLFPYAPHLGWHAVHLAMDCATDLNLCTAAGGAISTEHLVEMADAFQPNIIAGMSDYVRNRWLQTAQDKKITLPERVLFINGAQKMHEGERQKITEMAKNLGVKESVVLDFFGASELKEDVMPECAPGTGFHHIAPLSTVIRTVRTEGTTKGGWIQDWGFGHPSQGGAVALWNIDGAGTLLEGYVLGDTVERIAQHPCPRCGLRVERLFNVNRIREVEAQLALTGTVEAKVKGARVNLAAIREALLKLPEVAEAQIVAHKSALLLRIAPEGPRANAAPKVAAALQRLDLEVTPKIDWTTVDALMQGSEFKFRGIVIA